MLGGCRPRSPFKKTFAGYGQPQAMLIPISKDPNGIQEWGMVELQGDLETAVEKSGAHIGNITFTKVL